MSKIIIINRSKRLSLEGRILECLFKNPSGLTAKQIANFLNRPVSSINICLKNLISYKQVSRKRNDLNESVFLGTPIK